MRKKDEEVIEKVVNKIIDSNVLLTGDGDFYVNTCKGNIMHIVFRNLFSAESSIKEIIVYFNGVRLRYIDEDVYEINPHKNYQFGLWGDKGVLIKFGNEDSELETSPSFKRLVEYIEENKHLILHNDKEYGKSHTLTDKDFI